jgi:hypothetical protein
MMIIDNHYLRHEIETLKNARHRNILCHQDLITTHGVIVILCDYVVNGSLWEFLDGASKPIQKLDWRIIYNMVLAANWNACQ